MFCIFATCSMKNERLKLRKSRDIKDYNDIKKMEKEVKEKMFKERQEARLRRKLHKLRGCVRYTQRVADEALMIAGRFMTAEEAGGSDTYRVVEGLSCACEEVLEVLRDEPEPHGGDGHNA